MKISLKELLDELNKDSGRKIISEEDFKKAEKRINEEMEKFSIEQRLYFAKSRESASKAYITF